MVQSLKEYYGLLLGLEKPWEVSQAVYFRATSGPLQIWGFSQRFLHSSFGRVLLNTLTQF